MNRATKDIGETRTTAALLAVLGEPGAYGLPDPLDPGRILVRRSQRGVSIGGGHFPAATAEALVRTDLADWASAGTGARILLLTAMGRARLTREAVPPDLAFVAQHRPLEVAEHRVGNETVRVTVNAEESPLDWLRRRKGRDGQPLIDAASYEAGERLRRDLTQAQILPNVSARWSALPAGPGGVQDPAAATDAVIAARQRVTHALDALGGDLADLLIDLCGFLKGLETIERERGWPARSAKILVRLALKRLAQHYGLGALARGPSPASPAIRAWRECAGG